MKIKLTNRSKARKRKEEDSDYEDPESSEPLAADDWDGTAVFCGDGSSNNQLTAVDALEIGTVNAETEMCFNSAKRDLRETLAQFQKDEYLCDTILIGEDGQVKAHSVVLAAASTLLKSALKATSKPEEHVIVVPGMQLWLLETVVRYIYTDEIQVTEDCMTTDHLSKVVNALNEFGFNISDVSDVLASIDESLIDNIDNIDNIADTEHAEHAEPDVNDASVDEIELQGISSNVELDINELITKCSEQPDYDVKTNGKKKKANKGKKNSTKQLAIVKDDTIVEEEASEEGQQGYNRLCDQCGQVFSDCRKYLSHKKIHMKEPAHCPECGLMCSNRTNLRRHMFLHTGERPHLCQHCGEGFIQRYSLEIHMVSAHLDLLKRDPNFVEYKCEKCNETFYDNRRFQRHVTVECSQYLESDGSGGGTRRSPAINFDKPYGCGKCQKRFSLRASLLIHDQVHTKKKQLTARRVKKPQELKKNICRICGKWFKIRAAMLMHERNHASKKFKDGLVGEGDSGRVFEVFTPEPVLEMPFVCNTCGLKFRVRESLVSHERTHTGEKPYQCQECGHQTAYAGSLNTHMRVHTGEMPYTCNICGKQLRQSSHLVRHMWTHTGEKPYKCSMCDKGYKNRVDLRFHCQRVHQLELPKCPGRRSINDDVGLHEALAAIGTTRFKTEPQTVD